MTKISFIILFIYTKTQTKKLQNKEEFTMKMNIWIELFGIFMIISIVLLLCYGVIQKNKSVKGFLKRNTLFFSPNNFSYMRLFGGIPNVILFQIGMYIQSEKLVYAAIWFFTFLAMTDVLDGVIARATNLESDKGASLDAKADKWFDLPALWGLCFFPIIKPMYLITVFLTTVFDIIGQSIRGKFSSVHSEIIGKSKTTTKFVLIYLLSLEFRYNKIYLTFELETFIPVLLIFMVFFSGGSMALKTKWYQESKNRI